jgi:hypothetical protein
VIRGRASNTECKGFVCRKGMQVLIHILGSKAKSFIPAVKILFMESYLCDENKRFSLHEWLSYG